MSHTPGPWKIDHDCSGFMIETGDRVIALMDYHVNCDHDEDECRCDEADTKQTWADARLIAAAPDLLEALKHMLLVCENGDFDGCAFEYWAGSDALPIVRAAIAKAEGK